MCCQGAAARQLDLRAAAFAARTGTGVSGDAAVAPAPFLRWVGGKRQLLPVLSAALPADFDVRTHRYFEPFVGGGALLWSLASGEFPRTRRRVLVVNDVNPELAGTYRAVRDDVSGVVRALGVLARDTSRQAYYRARDADPVDPVERAARMIFLNRLSFNGLYRVNSSGGFNVPYGQLKNPKVLDEPLLRACSRLLGFADVRSSSFASAVNDARAGDVVYMDPPYVPLSASSSFSKYARDDFREMDQWALAGVVRGLTARGVRVVLSNSDTAVTREVFSDVLQLFSVSAARSVGAAAASRSRVMEVVGVNFDPGLCADPGVLAGLAAVPSSASLLA